MDHSHYLDFMECVHGVFQAAVVDEGYLVTCPGLSMGPLIQQTIFFDVLSLVLWVKPEVVGTCVISSKTDTLWTQCTYLTEGSNQNSLIAECKWTNSILDRATMGQYCVWKKPHICTN